MRVVWLITQRSRGQIPPPLQGQRPVLEQRTRFCIWFVRGMRAVTSLDTDGLCRAPQAGQSFL